jgi:hypothetical protein
MPKVLELDYIKTFRTRCVTCKHEGEFTTARQLILGYVMRPGVGGPDGPGYGVCPLCRMPGIRVIDILDPSS